MTDLHRARLTQLSAQRLDQAAFEPSRSDVVVSAVSGMISLGALVFAMSPMASFASSAAAYVASLVLPGAFLATRVHRKGALTIPVLLMVTSFACGPLGGMGCAVTALTLGRRLTPSRLQHWYEYIAGMVARDRIAHIYEELSSGRLSSDYRSEVPRFRPLLRSGSTEEQQRVLGVIGRRYHPDFRSALRDALRNRNGFIRAQAAAVASRLDIEEKKDLWSSAPSHGADSLSSIGHSNVQHGDRTVQS